MLQILSEFHSQDLFSKFEQSTLWKFQMGFNLFLKPHTRPTGNGSQPEEVLPLRKHLEMCGGGHITVGYDSN